MKQFLFIFITLIVCVISVNRLFAQDYLEKYSKDLTPSPMVAALGSFGGIEVRKSTGGISKNIPLFNISEGGVQYTPSIDYFSTGVKVDDYGSRVGIGWSEQITAVISRVVKGVPDERASSRIGDGQHEFGDPGAPDYTEASLSKMQSLAANNTTVDGQYDLFSYSLFGFSGQFIIKNNQAIILSAKDNIKISILTNSPTYQFLITKPNGEKLFFTSTIEETKFSSENSCDIDNPNRNGYISTAWFVDKVVSSTGTTMNFNYNYTEYTYLYDYSESYVFSSYNARPIPCDEGYDSFGYKTSCLRSKTTRTYLLNSVEGDNFEVYFNYRARKDIYNESLLSGITLMNKQGLLREVEMVYDEVVATSSLESGLLQHLSSDPVEHNALKTRYFLKELRIKNNVGFIDQRYGFKYSDPGVLPHHFSFAQDLTGCYNGKSNSEMVPYFAINGLNLTPPFTRPSADRSAVMIGSAGLLTRIEYPTGGKDTICYEQNKFRTTVRKVNRTRINDAVRCDAWPSYTGGFMDVRVNVEDDVELRIDCFYDSDEPQTQPIEEYWAEFELWANNQYPVPFPSGHQTVQLRLGETFHSSYYIGNGNFRRLRFVPETDYWLRVKIYGKNTALSAILDYTESIVEEEIDSAFGGYRVAKVISVSSTGQNLTRSYNYNRFIKNADMLSFTSVPSVHMGPGTNFKVTGVNECYREDVTGQIFFQYPIYRLLSHSNYDANIFSGFPHAYQHITEFIDSGKTSFIASEFLISPNGHGGRLFFSGRFDFAEPVGPPIENSASDNGLETRRFLGAKVGDKYYIDKETRWSYFTTSTLYYNYSASKLKEILYYPYSIQARIEEYMVVFHSNYCHWVKLDSMTEVNYFRLNGMFNTMTNKISYKYNAVDKFVEEEEAQSSKNEILLKQISRPTKMVASGRDPNGVYQEMLDHHIVEPEVEVVNKRDGIQISLIRTNYFKAFANMYVPKSIQLQQLVTDPVKTALNFLRYDNLGNILSMAKENDSPVNYIYSYKGRYPVAKIEYCDYDAIENIVGVNNLMSFRDNYPSSAHTDVLLAPLRLAVPNALITKFNFSPLVGMVEMTDPKGQTTYYEYDALGRLKTVRDRWWHILKQFDYQFSNAN